MPKLMLEIAGRNYEIGCREGEEAHFMGLARTVDQRIDEASQALGGLTETRGLLFAALLLADEVRGHDAAPAPDMVPAEFSPAQTSDPAANSAVAAIEHLADRVEALARALEGGG